MSTVDSVPPNAQAAAAEAYRLACESAEAGSDPRLAAARVLAEGGDVYTAMAWAFEAFSGFHFREGHRALALALQRDAGFLPARWLGFQYPLDPSHASSAEQQAFIERWRAGLKYFESLDYRRPEIHHHIWGCVGSATAFYLHYVDAAVPEMKRYGRLLARMMAQLDPGEPPRPLRTGRRRVIFASAFFREHTVARLFLPLIEGLDRSRFDIHLLDFEPGPEHWQRRVAAAGTRHAGPREAPEWAQLIRALQPDVLVYLELGMHPLGQGLAALRLAPRQACLWGHPVSTGLPTLDWVLSPDALEPANAQDHYSERLLRLPGLGHGLAAPVEAPEAAMNESLDTPQTAPTDDPADAPLDAAKAASQAATTVTPTVTSRTAPSPTHLRRTQTGSLEILCAQTAFKLLPAQDAVFARLLQALPQARLHLTPLVPSHVQDALAMRMRPVFAAHNVDFDTRVVLHPLMPLAEFQRLATDCDFGLDSLGWSGGMSALDLLPRGLPIIAIEGHTMRERQTAGLLRLLDLPELIAHDAEVMLRKAKALGSDPAERQRLREALQARAGRLYARAETQVALGEFLAG
jgi:predicted O-linked N-acetylglucosamine transferase (SPINDLY family)